MTYKHGFKIVVVVIAVVAVMTSLKLVRAGLLTNYVTSTISYILIGPSLADCQTPPGTDRQITVSWKDQDDNEAGFFIDRTSGSDGSQLRLQAPPAAGSGTTSTITDTRVVPDTNYTYTVKSFLGTAESAGQTTPLCTTQSPPVQPTNVQAVGSGEHSIYISWDDNSTNEQGFKIYRFRQDNPSGMIFNLVGPNVTTYEDVGADLVPPGLSSNTSYCYFVIAYNGRSSPQPQGQAVCTKTWSQPPQISNVTISNGPLPSLTWIYSDPDGPSNGQLKVRVEVCATPFNVNNDNDYSNDCPIDAWRWDSGQVTKNDHQITYLENYPNGVQQHLLDFGNTYYARLKVWDDSGTPSAWVLPNNRSSFTVTKDTDALVETFAANQDNHLTLTGGASLNSGYGGEAILNAANAAVAGQFAITGIISATLQVSQWSAGSSLKWYVYCDGENPTEITFTLNQQTGRLEAIKQCPTISNNLYWRAKWDSSTPPSASNIIGSLMVETTRNHPPVVNRCWVDPVFGNLNQTFTYHADISDSDAGDVANTLDVKWAWTGGNIWEDPPQWQDYSATYSVTHQLTTEGSFVPQAQARDSHGAVSAVADCEPVVVGTAKPAWLQTQNADIYSRGYIYGRPLGSNLYNATYLVQSNGTITNFNSSFACPSDDATCSNQVINPNYRAIQLPADSGLPLTTILGAVDLPGILIGKYGAVTNLSSLERVDLVTSFFNTLPLGASNGRVLNGQIVHVTGDAIILSGGLPIVLDNAGSTQSGAGLIIVDGDLTIQRPVVYTSTAVQGNLKRLASLAWLVKGNVYIDPLLWAVTADGSGVCADIASFNSCLPAVNGSFYLYNAGANHDKGIFFTGTNQTNNDNPLKAGGLVVAQRFALQRNISEATAETLPAELFSYDGRIFANTPPGLGDFAKAMPRWQPLAPLP